MQTNTHELARTYVDHVASVEARQSWPTPHDRLSEASQLFGEICVDASAREAVPDLGEVDAILRRIIIERRESSAERRQADLFRASIAWLPGGEVRDTQRRLTWKTGLLLDHCLKEMPERQPKFRSKILGEVGELSILGAFNIMDDPSYPALPAPPHHGTHINPIFNYDVALIDGPKLKVQKIEVKFGCQGLCNTPLKSPHKEHQRSKYGSDVALMSAHCDTGDIDNHSYAKDPGMYYDHRDQTGNLRFAELLATTAFRKQSVSDDDFWYLYHVGDTAIESITGTELYERLGKATSRHQTKTGTLLQPQAEGISPRARRKALRGEGERLPHGGSRASKGYTNKSRRSDRRIRGGRPQDFAY